MEQAIEFLTAAGHITDDRRQEFILLSDVLGASMQTIAVNNEAYGDATEATVFGPFFVEDAPEIAIGGDIAGGAAGEPCWVEGTVTDTDGKPVPGARIEVWEADEDGFYDVQYGDDRVAGRAHLFTDERRPVPLLGPHPDAVPDPARRAGRPDARSRRPLPDARLAPALHGHRARAADPRDAHLRPRRPLIGRRHRLRRQGLPDQGLRTPARRHPHPGRPRSRRRDLDTDPLRHRPRPQPTHRPREGYVTKAVTPESPVCRERLNPQHPHIAPHAIGGLTTRMEGLQSCVSLARSSRACRASIPSAGGGCPR